MPAILTKTLKNNHFLKFLSLIFGYMLWFLIASDQPITITQEIPIYFYNNFATLIKHDPEHIQVTLRGKRKALYLLNKTPLGIHIDKDILKPGVQYITIDEQYLLLPSCIQMINASPSHIKITIG